MDGPGYTIQIDESLFSGRRKFSRGRLLIGDKKPIKKAEIEITNTLGTK